MGRVKLQIKKIENTTNRQVTFSKRRNGLIKKAYELSVLCDVDVGVIMFSPSGRLSLFSGNKSIEEILTRYMHLPEHERGRMHDQEFLQRALDKLKAEAHRSTYQAHSPLNSNDSQIEEFQQENVKFKSKIEDMEKQLRILEGDLSNITTFCEAEYQEQILEEVLNRVRMRKQVLEENYNSPGAPPAPQVHLSPQTTDVKGFVTDSPNNILDWLPQRDPHVQILNFLDSNGLLPFRDQEQRVAEILPPASSTLLDGQNLNLVDHIIRGEDNYVQRPQFGQVINVNLSPWTEFYQTGDISIPTVQSRERALPEPYPSQFTPPLTILHAPHQYPT